MNNGFIYVWRKLRENPIYTNSKAVHIWIECLMRASYKGREFYQGREKVELKPGQFIMGYQEFGDKIGIAQSTVHFWLSEFEEQGMVERKSNAKGTIVTINNWKDYQSLERQSNGNRTDVESNNKDNNVKKVNKEYSEERLGKIKEVHQHWLDKCKDLNEARLNKNMKERIDTKLDKWTVGDMKTAIDHYREIYDSDFYYSHNWTLRKFVKQGNGIPRFVAGLDQEHDGDLWKDYKEQKKDKPKKKNSGPTYDTVTEEDREAWQ